MTTQGTAGAIRSLRARFGKTFWQKLLNRRETRERTGRPGDRLPAIKSREKE